MHLITNEANDNVIIKFIESFKKIKREISDEEHREFIAEQLEILKVFPELDKKTAMERLKKVLIYCGNKRLLGDYIALYMVSEDAIYFIEKDLKSEDIDVKRTRTHETIHAIIGPEKIYIMDRIAGSGLVEGTTERLVERIYGEKQAQLDMYYDQVICTLSRETVYKSAVCIVKQIEFIMQEDTTDFALNGNSQIFLDFSSRYGKDLFNYIRRNCNWLEDVHVSRRKEVKTLRELQKTILTRVFDIEFKKVNSLQSAEEYMIRLIKFQETQAFIIGDDSFKQYYCEKYDQILRLLHRKGITKDEINAFRQQHQYKHWINMNELPEEIKKKIIEINNQRLRFANIAKRLRKSQINRYPELMGLKLALQSANEQFVK